VLTAKKKLASREVIPTSKTANIWRVTQSFFRDNIKIVTGVTVAVLAISVFFYVYLEGKKSDELAASRELRLVQSLYQQEQYKLAISGDPARGIPSLSEIAGKFSGTNSGQIASLYLGNCYLYTGDVNKALQAYEQTSFSDPLLESAVIAGKAAVYETKKEFAEAAELYEEAGSLYENDVLSATRFFSAGRAYCLAKNFEKATSVLKRVKDAETPRFVKELDRLSAQYNLEID